MAGFLQNAILLKLLRFSHEFLLNFLTKSVTLINCETYTNGIKIIKHA